MNIKTALMTPLLISMAVSGFSQTKKPAGKPKAKPVVVNPAPVKGDQSLLWEITGMGIEEPSYLYGTMHIVCEGDANLSEGLKTAIEKSKQVIFEIDMDNMEEMMGMLKYARMTNGLKISDLVSPEEYARLETYFKNNKSILPFGMMARFKPYFITAIIAEGIMSCEKKSSVEQMIMTEAKKTDKEVLGLETLEFQASIFDSIPYEKQARDLVSYVDSIDKYKASTLEMVELYKKQDINSMDSIMIKSDPGMEQYMGILLYDRNKRWSIQIPDYARGKATLFAVGAGHLGGEKGVINLLKEMGYTLKPLKN
jgi:uncharacterized protein